ncbi:hypothetical protein Patl1_12295 [Pistacia atlantica]|uniref:Uncharacterized protein n=1 Tax=Pistacia atlantica TaxID=434234 RepID=A0ACC1A593_9ROSI|nr:hypothetical protein Patl1_12295 [Pistacia atlantica]
MESHEEKLHKLVLQSKINETKDVMKCEASDVDKNNIEKNRAFLVVEVVLVVVLDSV